MRNLKIALLIAVVFLLFSSCVRSLHPLFHDDDLKFDSHLLGTWTENNNIWIFEKSGETMYNLKHYEPQSDSGKSSADDTSKFEARLGRIGNFQFIDLYPEEPPLHDDLYKIHLIAAHTFSKLWFENDTLHIAMLDNDWLKKEIADSAIVIAHETLDDIIILTADTEDLQMLLRKFGGNNDAFPHPMVLNRVR